MKDKRETISHESYGLVQFNRITGSFRNLFGTNVDSNNAIALRIKRAQVDRHLNSNWYHGRDEIIEVILSPNQFSELLTTMNHGNGVPCTIQYVEGKRMESPPEHPSDVEKVREEFKERCEELDRTMNEFGQKIVSILGQKSIKKADKDEIISHLRMLHREVGSNFPFVLKCFNESTEEIVKDAKSVVDAFVTSTIAQAGIKSIQDNDGVVQVPKLSANKVDETILADKEK